MNLDIRPLTPGQEPVLFGFVRELAEYERLPLHVDEDTFAAGLRRASYVGAVLAWEVEADRETPVGYMLWYPTFSTFRAQSRVFLEDLYVTPRARGRGHGKALLAHLARETLSLGCDVLCWQVLDWNTPAIDFYRKLGADLDTSWLDCRLTGPALHTLATPRVSGTHT